MEGYLSEVKSLLRSILISTPILINVGQLNKDFIAQEGFDIPFEKFGYKSLIEFLKSIPDVLVVEGNSKYSQVLPVASEKSLHVNNLVMKQKFSSKPGSFSTQRRRCGRSNNSSKKVSCISPQSQKHQISHVEAKPHNVYTSQTSYSNNITTEQKSTREKSTNEKTTYSVNKTESKNKVMYISPKCISHSENSNKNIERLKESDGEKRISAKTCSNDATENKDFRRMEHKANPVEKKNTQNIKDLRDIDLSLKGSGAREESLFWKGGTLKKSRNRNSSNEHCSEVEYNTDRFRKSSGSNASGYVTKNSNYDSTQDAQKTKSKEVQHTHYPAETGGVSKKIKYNLRKLISEFPDGIWCAELPIKYKKMIGEELQFENYGYRCLIYLCFDLDDIFHCVKQSSCDYKLYDARKPLPKVHIKKEPEQVEIPIQELQPAIPEMAWGSFDSFLPPNVIKLGFQSKRIQADEALEVGISIRVTVAEIYDISKFWIILDDSKLDSLMNDMQLFYEEYDKKYLVPRSLLEESLHCVVLFHNKFHRAVILNTMPDEEYVKVYYSDYGTLGRVSKSEVWFLTVEFSELPHQAIRARLADIYPPFQGVTWSPFANYDFSNLTSMRKMTAQIMRIDKKKNMVDVKLRSSKYYISDVLVDKNHAIFINKTQQVNIEDPHCTSRVKFVHLFPTFEEIENWVVPSMEEAGDFLETTVTADFLYSQYFSRTVDSTLIDSIEEKMKRQCAKKKSLLKNMKPFEEDTRHSMDEMNQIAFGALYQPPTIHSETYIEQNEVEYNTFEETQDVSSRGMRIIDIENDELLIGILRQTRLKKSYSGRNTEYNEKNNESLSNGSSSNQKSRNFSSFLELEKYLSDEDSSKTSKRSTSNLIDLEDDFNTTIPSTNLLADKEFDDSLAKLATHRPLSQKCLLTDSNLYDVENTGNPLDLPIPTYVPVSTFPDLIQFDNKVSNLEVSSSSDTRKNIKPPDGSEETDADDEDSDDQLNKLKAVNRKKYNCESTQEKTSRSTRSDWYLGTSLQHSPAKFTNKVESKENEKNCPTTTASGNMTNQPSRATFGLYMFSSDFNISNRSRQDQLSSDGITATHNCLNGESHNEMISHKVTENSNFITQPCDEQNNIKDTDESDKMDMSKVRKTVQNNRKYCVQGQVNIEKQFSDISNDSSTNELFDNPTNPNGVSNGYQNSEDKDLCTEINSPCSTSNSIVTINSGETELPNEELTSKPAPSLNNFYNNILHKSSASNLYFDSETKVPDSSIENYCDFPSCSSYSDSVNTSTSVPTLNKDKSFLEEFDILNLPPITNSLSDISSGTLKLSFLSGESMSLDSLESTEAAVLGAINVNNNVKTCDKSESATGLHVKPVSNAESQLDIPNWNNQSFPIPRPPFVPNPMQQNFVQRMMHPPGMMVIRPPPGFHPVPRYEQRPMLHPFGVRYSYPVPQQEMMMNGAQNYNNPPIVVINYNFLPPMNQNSH